MARRFRKDKNLDELGYLTAIKVMPIIRNYRECPQQISQLLK
jgi:hypothetical protein